MATCAVRSALLATPRVMLPFCALVFSDGPRSVRVARSAGPIPNSTAVIADRTAVNASTRGSMRASTMGVSRAGSHSMKSFPHQARMAPPIPPSMARRRVSVSNCRITRQRLAPSVRRTATSWRRADARTSRRVARLTHPISRMAATTANTADRICCASMRGPSGPCAPGRTRSCGSSLRVGFGVSGGRAAQLSRTVSANVVCSSASACSRVTPGFNRPIIWSHQTDTGRARRRRTQTRRDGDR